MESSFKEEVPNQPSLGVEGFGQRANWLTARLSGPGGYYNIGNVIALLGGATVQVAQSPVGQSSRDVLAAFLFGSPGATWLTISMVVFTVAGEFYHRAYARAHAPSGSLIRLGDAFAGIAAVMITVALIHFGDTVLAVIAGTLLAVGKFGTALLPRNGGNGPTTWPRTEAWLRRIVVLSRFPSLGALSLEVLRSFLTDDATHVMIMPAIMTFCFLLWLRADLLLMANSKEGSEQT